MTVGLHKNAEIKQRRDKSGNGFESLLVLRRPRSIFTVAVFSTIICGGCALLAWYEVLEGGAVFNLKGWLALIGSAGFTAISLLLFPIGLRRIELSENDITVIALWHAPRRYKIADLIDASPVLNNFTSGILLKFKDGRQLKIHPYLIGYRDLLSRLGKTNFKVQVASDFVEGQMNKED